MCSFATMRQVNLLLNFYFYALLNLKIPPCEKQEARGGYFGPPTSNGPRAEAATAQPAVTVMRLPVPPALYGSVRLSLEAGL